MHNIHPHNATEYSTVHNDHSHNALWQQCTISKLTMNCGNCTLTMHCAQCGNRLHNVHSHRAHYANRCTPLHCNIPNSLEVSQCTICALLLLHNMHHKQCAPTKHCSHCNMYIVHTPFKSATGCITGMHSPELSPRPAIHWESSSKLPSSHLGNPTRPLSVSFLIRTSVNLTAKLARTRLHSKESQL